LIARSILRTTLFAGIEGAQRTETEISTGLLKRILPRMPTLARIVALI